jgi:CheY-like chemotaxis protein
MKPKILIVDDDPMCRELVQEICSVHDIPVIAARHGKEALSILEKQHVGLIISDVNMPEMDGLTFHTNLLMNDHLTSVPFVFITGSMDEAVSTYLSRRPGIRLINKSNLVTELTELLSHLQ